MQSFNIVKILDFKSDCLVGKSFFLHNTNRNRKHHYLKIPKTHNIIQQRRLKDKRPLQFPIKEQDWASFFLDSRSTDEPEAESQSKLPKHATISQPKSLTARKVLNKMSIHSNCPSTKSTYLLADHDLFEIC